MLDMTLGGRQILARD